MAKTEEEKAAAKVAKEQEKAAAKAEADSASAPQGVKPPCVCDRCRAGNR